MGKIEHNSHTVKQNDQDMKNGKDKKQDTNSTCVFFHFFRQNIGARDEGRGSVEEAEGEKTSRIPEIEMNHVKKW